MAQVRLALAVLAGTILLGSPLAAQCPDGSPPPCRTGARAAAPRPPNLPLDEHTWIVLPFENQARAADLDWLKDASVNLLYLDLSRWSDVRAIDDKRVADYLRAVPSSRAGSRLTLGDGRDVARRAGAGKLVMGEFLKAGNLTRVTATAYDVRTGSRIRSVTEQTPVVDSLMSVFGKLARGLLNVPPPSGASVGTGGTSNVAALQEYLAGVKALNRFDLAGARPRFDKALQLDSTFALAHYKYAIMIGWDTPSAPAIRTHGEAAQRFAAALPPRERTLIAGLAAFSSGDFARAADRYRELVRADSNDVEALYGLADCLYHDPEVLPPGTDTARLAFRSSWNESIRLFQRVLKLDPSYHLAFQHILDGLTADIRAPGCRRASSTEPCSEGYSAVPRRSGDTLVLTPVSQRFGGSLAAVHTEEARRTYVRARSLEQARVAAEDWMAAAPEERRARISLARVELLLGHVSRADELLAGIGDAGTQGELMGVARDRVEIAIKRGLGVRANQLLDSAFATLPRSNSVRIQFGVPFAVLGRPALFDTAFASLLQAQRVPPVVLRYFLEARRLVLGAPGDSFLAAERALVDSLTRSVDRPCNALCITNNLLPSLVLGLAVRRTWWPPIDPAHADWRLGPARALSRGDTAALRIAVRRLDSLAAADAAAGAADDGVGITIADGWLALRDSTRALSSVRRMLDTTSLRTPVTRAAGMPAIYASWTWPRAMLLRADLAAGLGHRDEARTWYKRWLDLWSKAEPEFQPLVERVKKSYAAVGGT